MKIIAMPPEERFKSLELPLTVSGLRALVADLLGFTSVKVVASVKKIDYLYGTSEGNVTRVVYVPARDELVLYTE